MKGKTICFDFDGVLHSYRRGWTGLNPEDPPVPGAQEAVRKITEMGYDVVVHSARARDAEGVAATRAWLESHKFPKMRISSTKPGADLYIDDRGFRFVGDWDRVFGFLQDSTNFTPWMKKKPQWQTLSAEERNLLLDRTFFPGLAVTLDDAWEMVKHIPEACRGDFHDLMRKETAGWPLYMRSPVAAAELMFECALKVMGVVE